jgi:hypothetical protein
MSKLLWKICDLLVLAITRQIGFISESILRKLNKTQKLK